MSNPDLARPTRPASVRALAWICGLALIPILFSLSAAAQKSPSKGVGIVYGKVLKPDGRPLGGVWLMIENLELGMIYRKDVNPIGQFEFVDVYPGTYVFKLSPALYLIKSPVKITVKADEALEVQVQVVRAPESGQNQRNFFPERNQDWRRSGPPGIILASLALQVVASPSTPQQPTPQQASPQQSRAPAAWWPPSPRRGKSSSPCA